jgi:hypothetical protein
MLLLDNSKWIFRNGQNIDFWSNNWCGEPFINLHSVSNIALDVDAKISVFILNSQWLHPQELISNFPQLAQLVLQEIIPNQDRQDQLVWKHTNIGTLTLKEVFKSKSHQLMLVGPKPYVV